MLCPLEIVRKLKSVYLTSEYILSYLYQLTSCCLYVKSTPDFNKNGKLVFTLIIILPNSVKPDLCPEVE